MTEIGTSSSSKTKRKEGKIVDYYYKIVYSEYFKNKLIRKFLFSFNCKYWFESLKFEYIGLWNQNQYIEDRMGLLYFWLWINHLQRKDIIFLLENNKWSPWNHYWCQIVTVSVASIQLINEYLILIHKYNSSSWSHI